MDRKSLLARKCHLPKLIIRTQKYFWSVILLKKLSDAFRSVSYHYYEVNIT